jgi:dolichol-phosphate mannosyltransferase
VQLLSVVIPARDERDHLPETLRDLHAALARAGIPHELVVVDDHSSDDSVAIVSALVGELPVVLVENARSGGYGNAVVSGIEHASGDAVAIVMADGSDNPDDLVTFVRAMRDHGVDCVFGTRFSRGGRTVDYPLPKLLLNRLANNLIRLLFRIRYDDVTNAFKLYSRAALDGSRPFLSHHFNLTVELPLKAIIRGYSYVVVPNTWTNRREGISKFQIKEMGSRYVFIVLYCWLEARLSRGDYVRT